MSTEKGNAEGIGVERVGETIHRERLTRNILIETVADDLKMNPEFIRGIEESDYSSLPTMTYIRVYIKTISEYLNLDSEELLERFSAEQNLSVPDPVEERRDTISVKVQGEKKRNPFFPLMFIAVAVVVIIFLLKKPKGEEGEVIIQDTDTLVAEPPLDTAEISDDSLPHGVTGIVDSVIPDSIPEVSKADSTVNPDTAKELAAAETVIEAEDTVVVKKKQLDFTVYGRGDSSWMRIFVDGESKFDGFLLKKKRLSFTAADSVNYVVGKNSGVRYRLNDKPFQVAGAGLKVVKVTSDTVEVWKMSKWKQVFSGRL